jgi:hypothetical protein
MQQIDQSTILATIASVKPKFDKQGIILEGLFGSYAKDLQNIYSDIDIAYHLDYAVCDTYYPDGFAKLEALENLKNELQEKLHRKVDLISLQSSNKTLTDTIRKEMLHV